MSKPQHFHSELHLHLYGCISAKSLWEFGKETWRDKQSRLEWYAAEYALAYGRVPDFAAYWQKEDGFERLQRDFEFTEPAPFNCFQARFNLLIALKPIIPTDGSVLHSVLSDLRQTGLRHAEVRTVLPPTFAGSDAGTYLRVLADVAARVESESGGSFVPRIALSLPRRDDLLWQHYQWLKEFRDSVPEKAHLFGAVDFSNYEEGFPPRDKAKFFSMLHRDNCHSLPLAVLYHVGESFSAMTIMSAARWIYETSELGAHRLGHCIALGLDPENLRGRTVKESVKERRDHLLWLKDQARMLGAHGYLVDVPEVERLLTLLDAHADETVSVTYDTDTITDARSLQDAIMRALATQNVIIESCPTSNFRIGQIQSAAMHPLPRFLRAGLKVIVSTDDPGIFAIDLAAEENVCRDTLGLSEAQLKAIAAQSEHAQSQHLVSNERSFI